MARRGRSLEKLIKVLELALNNTSAIIESPKFLTDRVTGTQREHDVVITTSTAHHELLVAIECRDRNTSIGTPEVEQFWTKCKDTGVSQAVMVSATGFTKPGLTKAAANGIRCLSLDEVDNFPWLLISVAQKIRQELQQLDWIMDPVSPELRSKKGEFDLCDSKGKVIPRENLDHIALQFVSTDEWYRCPPSGDFCVAFFINPAGNYFMLERATGEIHALECMLARGQFKLIPKEVPIERMKYSDKRNSKTLAEAAYVRGESDEPSIVIINDPKVGGSIHVIPPDVKKGV